MGKTIGEKRKELALLREKEKILIKRERENPRFQPCG